MQRSRPRRSSTADDLRTPRPVLPCCAHRRDLGGESMKPYSIAKRMALVFFGTLVLGTGLAFAFQASERAEPAPVVQPLPVRVQPPLHMARVRAQCVPVFTDEERQRLFEKCDHDGGRVRSEHSVISCFKLASAWYDEAIWIKFAEDYPRSELSEPLPSWVMTEGYRLVRTEP